MSKEQRFTALSAFELYSSCQAARWSGDGKRMQDALGNVCIALGAEIRRILTPTDDDEKPEPKR